MAEAAPQPAEPKPLDKGDNAWMLVSSALVLMMTAPGLAMFYGGLVRKKNVLSVIMQCVFLMGLMSVIWALWGYSLSFGGGDAWIGNADYLFMKGVQAEWVNDAPVIPQHASFNIPVLTHMLFQGMFFIITPALICGAFAERMKFSTMVVFSVIWGTIVYCPLCHWVWGGGILAYNSEHAMKYSMGGALDFAGGTVVHISSGVSALLCALLIGKRIGFGHRADAAAQSDVHGPGCGTVVGRLVRLQRRQRAGRRRHRRQRFCRDTLFGGRRRVGLAALPSGSKAANRPCWAPARAPWRDWCASPRPLVMSRRCRRS